MIELGTPISVGVVADYMTSEDAACEQESAVPLDRVCAWRFS